MGGDGPAGGHHAHRAPSGAWSATCAGRPASIARLPFAVTVDGAFAGQVTVTNIVGGSARWAQVGYWVDRRYAGQSVIPTAVAMVVDHCFSQLQLHRIEVAIRPENAASLRVVEKLGFTEIGYAPGYLHIDGAWRDHRLFAITTEDVPEGLLARFKGSQR